MDEETKTTSKRSLVEAYLTREEVASPILIVGPTNTNPLWKLEPILESTHGVNVQPIHLLKGVKSPNLSRGRNGGISFHRVTAR